MALGRAGGSERKRAAHNSALLGRATRRTRALRLEHDPQPVLNGCTGRRRRGFFVADGFGLAGKPPYPDVLKGLGSFRFQRRSAKRTDLWRAAMSVPQGNRGFSRSPDARTRQIQIRNRQQHLHTAAGAGWQARGGSASGWTFGSRRPDLGSFGGRFWRNLTVRQQPRLV